MRHYRPEIDGLRALAVLPVVFYHGGFEVAKGGFVGVDVFFVISGYLITSIILSDISAGTFSLLNFYERRARRILPALFFVMAASVTFSWFAALPTDFEDLAQSVVAVSLFVSNVLFWRQTGYFDETAEVKPLIHTWSLAVEEQFYMLFPVFLLLTWRWGKRWTIGLIAFGTLVSVSLAHWGAYNRPEATFFLLPTRAWELGIGALVAFHSDGGQAHRPGARASAALSGLGLFLIGYAVFRYDSTTPFPSLYALAPTVGTALILMFAHPGTWVGRVLACKPLVGIGLVSYSAYLWHQPLFAFARHHSIAEPSYERKALLIVLSLSLAYLSWRLIELPFRKPGSISRKQVWTTVLVSSIAFIGIGGWGVLSHGFEERYVARLNDRQQKVWNGFTRYAIPDDGECRFHSEEISPEFSDRFDRCFEKYGKGLIVLGDSHARSLYSVIFYNGSRPFLFGLSAGGCRPHTNRAACFYDSFLPFLEAKRDFVDRVLYTQAGYYLVEDSDGIPGAKQFFTKSTVPIYRPNPKFIERVVAYLAHVAEYSAVVWVGPWIEPHQNARKLLKLALRCQTQHVSIDPNIVATFVALDVYLKSAARAHRIPYVSAVDALRFESRVDLYDCNGPYWRDGDHFSALGERRFGSRLTDVVDAGRPEGP